MSDPWWRLKLFEKKGSQSNIYKNPKHPVYDRENEEEVGGKEEER